MGLSNSRAFLCAVVVSLGASSGLTAEDATSLEARRFFENEVRPLLVESCLKCHGALKQESNLRLDSPEALLAGGLRGPAVVPGDASASRLLQFVQHTGDIRMPPTRKLDERSIEVLRRWIDEGAIWPKVQAKRGFAAGAEDHWAYQPLTAPQPPRVAATSAESAGSEWVRTDVDRFILARLQEAGVRPVPEADRRTWLRRVTLDLTGLPPTVAGFSAFLADRSPDAESRVVDRLLGSPAYGERWGRHWLDVARYADTAGETADYPVPPAYRYRNYVIDSFNADKPFDEFAKEQIAGDILAEQGPRELVAERRTATGFIALSRRFGYDVARYQHMTIQDTLDTLGQAFLGLSLGCARCHEHKYDPVSTADYYSLYGIFASTRYSFPGSEEKKFVRAYLPLLPESEANPIRVRFESEIRELESELLRRKLVYKKSFFLASLDDIDGNFELQAEARGGSEGVPVLPWSYKGGAIVHARSQSRYTNVFARARIGLNLAGDQGRNAIWQVLRPSYSSEKTPRVHLNVDLNSRTAPPTVTEGKAAITEPLRRLGKASEDTTPGSYRLALLAGEEGPASLALFVRRLEGARSELVLRPGADDEQVVGTLKADAWYQLRLDLDLVARRFVGRLERAATDEEPAVRYPFSGAMHPAVGDGFSVIRFDDEGSPRGVKPCLDVDNIALSEVPLPDLELKSEASSVVASEAPADESEEAKARGERLRAEFYSLIENGPYPRAYGVVESNPRDVRIHERGDPDLAGDLAPRRWLEIFGGDRLSEGTVGSGRLELANWVVAKNPLFARVIVNRVWQKHFGRGLVATTNDFGTRGADPTHPELLDYLASRLTKDGWSLKALHRLIVLSTTYRLASDQDAESYAKDPEGLLRWRFERRRLSAEEIRDGLLAFGGRLERRMAGRHPFPPMAQKQYSQHGPFRGVYDTRARSVYLMTQRLQRHPFLSLFDAPERNASFGQRTLTTVPTQALYFMNSPFVHEQSKSFALRLPALAAAQRDEETSAGLARVAYRVVLGREPTFSELERVQGFVSNYVDALQQETDSEPAAGAGAVVPSHEATVPVWAALARTLFASNEYMYVD